MAIDRLRDSLRQAVMHKPVASANTPQWRSAELIGRALTAILNDPIASTHVVQREIAERMDDLIAQRRRNSEGAAINQGARCRGCESSGVSNSTAN